MCCEQPVVLSVHLMAPVQWGSTFMEATSSHLKRIDRRRVHFLSNGAPVIMLLRALFNRNMHMTTRTLSACIAR
jgi:hypothetical protein